MNYLETVQKKIKKYQSKGHGRLFILFKLIVLNFKFLFKDTKFDFGSTYISDDICSRFSSPKKSNEILIAFKSNGANANVLIHLNLIKKLLDKVSCPELKVVFFGGMDKEFNDAVFKNLSFIYSFHESTELREDDYSYYDAVVELDLFADVVRANFEKIHAVSLELYQILFGWFTFKNNELYSNMFKLRPKLDCNIYKWGMLNGKNCLDIADVDNVLNIEQEYSFDIETNETKTTKLLKSLNLEAQKFITIQRPNCINNSTLSVPDSILENAISLLKTQFNNLKVVQVGMDYDASGSVLKGVDVYLVGKTSWEDVKILLNNALYHVGIDSDLVHLRKALKSGPSIVLFGPTPVEFWGYNDNINISSEGCHNCMELTDNWRMDCLQKKGSCLAECSCNYELKKLVNGKK